jgi:hypothetical protein
MRKWIFYSCIFLFLLAACKRAPKPYENSMGIQPSLVAEIDTANYTRVDWTDSLQKFDPVTEGKDVELKFNFTNAGKTPLFLLEAKPGCGCTVVDYPKEALLPGESGVLKAVFNTTGHAGKAMKTIIVKTNTKNGAYHKLIFEGDVSPAKK